MDAPRLLPLAEIPIACSLGATELTGRLADWRHVLTHVTARAHRDGGHEVVLTLSRDAPLGELATLCRDEVACCPFFTFELTITAGGAQLRIAVPVDAAPVLAEFARLLPASAR